MSKKFSVKLDHQSSHLVQDSTRNWGRFTRTPIANPNDEFSGFKRLWRQFRTKEWVGFDISHPEIYAAMIIQDAKILKTSEIYFYESNHQLQTEHHAVKVGSNLKISEDLLHSSLKFKTQKYHLEYLFDDQKVVIRIGIPRNGSQASIEAEIILDAQKKSHPLVVSALLPPSGTMYTNKIIFPASGWVKIDDRSYTLEPERDLLIMDEHKSQLPYRTQWTWGTFAYHSEGNFVGANFATRPQYPDQEEESCIWTPDGVEPLSNITFSKMGTDVLSPWKITSEDGRLDVTFTPTGRKVVKENLLVFAIDYFQMFGKYSGTLKGKNKTWTFKDINGLCEDMKMRS